MKGQKGVSLVEIMISLAIFSVIGFGIFTFQDILPAQDGKSYDDTTRQETTRRSAIEVAEQLRSIHIEYYNGTASQLVDTDGDPDFKKVVNKVILEAGYNVSDFDVRTKSFDNLVVSDKYPHVNRDEVFSLPFSIMVLASNPVSSHKTICEVIPANDAMRDDLNDSRWGYKAGDASVDYSAGIYDGNVTVCSNI